MHYEDIVRSQFSSSCLSFKFSMMSEYDFASKEQRYYAHESSLCSIFPPHRLRRHTNTYTSRHLTHSLPVQTDTSQASLSPVYGSHPSSISLEYTNPGSPLATTPSASSGIHLVSGIGPSRNAFRQLSPSSLGLGVGSGWVFKRGRSSAARLAAEEERT